MSGDIERSDPSPDSHCDSEVTMGAGVESANSPSSKSDRPATQSRLSDKSSKTARDDLTSTSSAARKESSAGRKRLGGGASRRSGRAIADAIGGETLTPNQSSSRLAKSSSSAPLNSVGDSVAEPRYQAIGELGRGGWGVVQRAIDHQLQREVAVKRIGDSATTSNEARQRFLHEAKVTSQLQHPGIVPVHELRGGEDHHEEAFYVMKLLEGDTLRTEIRRVHRELKQARKSPSSNAFHDAILPLLHRFVDICDAVGYAHEQGVLHRDLKPANVMVGRFGETIVVDWGLAKQVGMEDTYATIISDPAEFDKVRARGIDEIDQDLNRADQFVGQSKGSGVQTSQGSIIGTPAYMSPEQARGEIGNLRPASDIYSLGVILYEILVGVHPFAGEKLDVVLRRVQASQWKPAREVNSWIARPISVVSQIAMHARPNERYGSASNLAEDVRRYIAGDAVSVDQEPVTERMARWCRRHRTAATVTAAITICGLLASLAMTFVMHRAHEIERIAHSQTQAAQGRAIDRQTQTRQATDRWLIELSGTLQFYPGLAPIRAELIANAIEQYSSLSSVASEDLRLLSVENLDPSDPLRSVEELLRKREWIEKIQCDCRLGDLYRLSGNLPLARQHYLTALSQSTQLAGRCEAFEATSQEAFADVSLEQINARIGLLLSAEMAIGDQVDRATFVDDDRYLSEWLEGNSPSHSLDRWCRRASGLSRLLLAWTRSRQSSQIATVDHEFMRRASHWATRVYLERGTNADARWLQTVLEMRADLLRLDDKSTAEQEVLWTLISHLNSLCDTHPGRIDYRQSLGDAKLRLGISLAATECGSKAERGEKTLVAQKLFSQTIGDLQQSLQMADGDEFCLANLARARYRLGSLIVVDAATRDEGVKSLRASIAGYQQLLRVKLDASTLREFCVANEAMLKANPPLPVEERIKIIQSAELSLTLLRDHELATAADKKKLGQFQRELAALQESSQSRQALPVTENGSS